MVLVLIEKGQQYNVGEKPTVILYCTPTLIAMQGHQNGSEAKYTMNLDTQYSSINFVTLGLRSNGCPHYYITILELLY